MALLQEIKRRVAGISARDNSAPGPAAENLRRWLAALIAGPPARLQADADTLSLVKRSRLLPLAAFSGVGDDVLGAERRTAFAASVAIQHASAAVVALLRGAEIPCVTLKGPAFAAQIHGDAAMRASCDVDLLVRRSDLPRVRAAFAAAGMAGSLHYPAWYEERWHDHAAFGGLPGVPRASIEVHWDIVRPGLSALPVADLLSEAVTVPCGAAELPAPVVEWQIVLAAAHAAQHFFDARGLLDVGLCGVLLGADGWNAAADRAERARLEPALYHAVVLSAAWLDWPPPDAVARLRPGRMQERLADAYLRSWDPWQACSWGSVQLGKVGTPLCISSRLGGLPGMLFSLTDRPNVCRALDERLSRLR